MDDPIYLEDAAELLHVDNAEIVRRWREHSRPTVLDESGRLSVSARDVLAERRAATESRGSGRSSRR